MSIPDMNDQIQARLDKLSRLKEQGINPFPYKFERSHTSKELFENQSSLLAEEAVVRYAGRVVRFNRKGKMAFMHLKDQWGRLQIVCARDEVGLDAYEVVKCTDIGDWIGVEGKVFETPSGEFSIRAIKYEFLSKAVRPLPIPKEKVDKATGEKVIFDEFKRNVNMLKDSGEKPENDDLYNTFNDLYDSF